MNWHEPLTGENEDKAVEQALRNFKASVHAWSDAAWSESVLSDAAQSNAARPRTAIKSSRHGWRLAAGWALGCAVAAMSVAGALHEREHRQQQARVAAAQAATQKAAQQKLTDVAQQLSAAQTDEDLLANVDSDISRAVPAAMEPLAQMMDQKQADDNGTQ
jgi:hypothetical protein